MVSASLSLADAEAAARRGLPGDGEGDLGVLARSCRRERALLREHPSLTLTCLAQLGFGRSDATRLAERWSEEWTAAGRGPWLRSLRACQPAATAPTSETYRGSLRSAVPWFSEDSTVVGVTDGRSCEAWDRTSGLRLARTPRSAAPPRFTLTDPDFGRLRLVDSVEGRTYHVEVDEFDKLQAAIDLPDGKVLACGYDIDNFGVAMSCDPASNTVAWRVHLDGEPAVAVSACGTVAAFSDKGVTVVDCATGRRLALLPDARGTLALSDDRSDVATFERGEMRVWDVRAASKDSRRDRGGDGLVTARFSPDGRLLLCGSRLFDGGTGELLTELPLHTPGGIEGGPARGCTAVLNDGVLEAQATLGVGMIRWATSGEVVWSDPSRHYSLSDRLSFSADGSRYTHWSNQDPNVLRILETESGREVRRLEVDAMCRYPTVVFSPDGTRIRVERRQGAGATRAVDTGRPAEPFQTRAVRRSRVRRGLSEVCRDDGAVVARAPVNEALVASPDGRFWAGRYAHFVLEPGASEL